MRVVHLRELSEAPLTAEYCLIRPSQVGIGLLRASPHPPASAALIKMFASDTNLSLFLSKMLLFFGKQKSTLGESALGTYAATRDRWNLLLLREFCAASEILETLLTSKIKL